MNLGNTVSAVLFIAFFIAGVGVPYYFGVSIAGFDFFGNAEIDLVLLCIGVFVLSIMFFGYISFVPVFIAGLVQGSEFSAEPFFVLLSALPVFLAAYAGSYFGKKVLSDFQGKGNFSHNLKAVAALVVVFVLLAAGVGFSKPYLQEIEIVSEIEDFISGFMASGGDSNGNQQAETIDCGNDFDCFISASENCLQAKVTVHTELKLFGIVQTTESYLEIKGSEGEECIFYIMNGPTELEFPEGTPQETIDEITQAYQDLEGRNGECRFDSADLTSLLNAWKTGDISEEDWDAGECSGEYFSS